MGARTPILDAYDELRRTAAEAGFQRRALETAVLHYPLAGSSGFVSYSRNATDLIDAVIAEYEQRGCDFEWKVYSHDEPSDLKDRLGARGFEVGAAEELMVLALADARAWIDAERAFRIESGSAALAAFLELQRGGVELQDPERDVPYVAYEDGAPAACARATYPEGFAFAGLWSGFTRPESRGRGLYRALVAVRAREAADRGYEYVTVDAQPTSRPILERLGFRRVATTWPCRWTR